MANHTINYIIFQSVDNQICLIDLGEEFNAATTLTPPHPRFHYIIHFVVSGEGRFTTTEVENQRITAGNAFAIYENDTVYYESDKNNPLHYFWIGFNGKDSEDILAYIGFSQKAPISEFKNIAAIQTAFQSLFDTWKNEDRFVLLSKFYSLVALMHDCNKFRQNNAQADESILSRSLNLMNLNLTQNYKINDLVNELCIDRSYFSKIFKKKYNVSPYQYFLRLKLQKAEYLLKNTTYNVTQISDMLGFTDHYMFSKAFKRRYGVPPLTLRKQSKSRQVQTNKS